MQSNCLIVEHEGETRALPPTQTLTFGREADLVIDGNNQALHPCAGSLQNLGGLWLLENRGLINAFVLTDLDSSSYGRLCAGKTMCLPFAHTLIDVAAGPVMYRIAAYQTAFHEIQPAGVDVTEAAGSKAISAQGVFDDLNFNTEQMQLLRALAAPRLAGPMTSVDLPSSRELAATLGWSLSKFNRKLDHLCLKLARAGVHGVVAEESRRASERRLVLANFAVENGLARE